MKNLNFSRRLLPLIALLFTFALPLRAETVTYTFSDVASANSWSNGVAYTNVKLGNFTFAVTGGGNNGKYYTSDVTWRFYSGGGLNITPDAGYTITSVSSNPTSSFGVSQGKASISFSATVKYKSITINYTTSGGGTTPDPGTGGGDGDGDGAGDGDGETASFIFNTDAGLSALGITKPSQSQGTNLGTSNYTASGIVMTATDGSSKTRVWNSQGVTSLRVYAANGGSAGTLTFSGATITKIDFTGTVPMTASVGTFSNKIWTGNSTSVTFTATNTTEISKIVVTYEASGSTPEPSKTTPTLSFANGTYNATMGEGFTAPTLNNPQGVTVSYTSSAEGVARVDLSTGEIELVAPGTTKITASFAGNETYNAKSASYDLVVSAAQAPALTTMDAIFAAATTAASTATDCRVTFNNWVVSGVKGSNAYVTDKAGKGFMVYGSGHGFVVGDVLSGTVACKVQLYNGSAELTALTTSTDGLTVTKGGTITPVTSVALASLSGVNTGAVVSYENLQYDGTNFTDGVTSLKPYNTFITLPTLVNGKNYNVTGVYIHYVRNDVVTKEIAPRAAEDFELNEVLNKFVVTIQTSENGTIVVKNGETVINAGDEVAEGTTLTIECTPTDAENYRYKNWQYKAGEAAWATRTADFTYIMPSENVQFRANFEVIPTHTINWYVNGSIVQTETLKEGAAVTAPNPADINDKKFMGWVAEANKNYYHATDEPEFVTPQTTATASANYYAVFATQEGEGGAPSVHELTQNQIADAYVGSGDNKTTSYGTYDFGSSWSGSCLINKYNNVCFVQIRKNAANNYILTPDFGDGVTSITINTTASGATQNTVSGREFYLCANNETAQPTSGNYGSGAITTANGSVTISVTGNPHQFYIYANGAAYVKSISVTYGGGATYSKYTTLAYTRSVTSGNYGTICLPFAVSAAGVTNSNATFYSIAGVTKSGENITGVVIEEKETLVAGTPYIFKASADQLTCVYSGEPVDEPVAATGLIGTLTNGTLNLVSGQYYIGSIDNKLHKWGGADYEMEANKAVIDLSEVGEYVPSAAPVRIIAMADESQVATGLDELNTDSIQKFFQNGQVYILREGRLYDATGRLVK